MILDWVHKRWLIRCELFEAQIGTHEHRKLLEECRSIWRNRSVQRLFIYDRHLLSEECAPRKEHTVDYLRAWRRTRVLAVLAYSQRKLDRGQTRIADYMGDLHGRWAVDSGMETGSSGGSMDRERTSQK